jgi:hypothetical protein
LITRSDAEHRWNVRRYAHDRPRRQRVAPAKDLIVGAGFGGLAAKIPPAPFRHRSLGNLAPIGRKEAFVDLLWIKLGDASPDSFGVWRTSSS